jgi:hypothetical protein
MSGVESINMTSIGVTMYNVMHQTKVENRQRVKGI